MPESDETDQMTGGMNDIDAQVKEEGSSLLRDVPSEELSSATDKSVSGEEMCHNEGYPLVEASNYRIQV